jgi:hypothetical protein
VAVSGIMTIPRLDFDRRTPITPLIPTSTLNLVVFLVASHSVALPTKTPEIKPASGNQRQSENIKKESARIRKGPKKIIQTADIARGMLRALVLNQTLQFTIV